jgi:uncharacterized protein YkwD
MKSWLSRRAPRALDHRIRTYGITAALGLFSIGGVLPQCAPAPPPAVVQMTNVQQSVVDTVNQHRANAGLRPVAIDARLTAAAQGHSDHMARERIMTHIGAGWTDGGMRISNAGYRWRTWGENVASGQATAADVMAAWMASPGHRANILRDGVVHIGIAATKASNGVVYWTMVLAAG